MRTDKLVNAQLLRELLPLCNLPQEFLEALSRRTYFETLAAGERVFIAGMSDPWAIYLLSGEMELSYPGGTSEIITGGSPKAQTPLAHIKPRLMTATAKGPVLFLRVNEEVFEEAVTDTGRRAGGRPASGDDESIEENVLQELDRAFKAGKLIVPSLPDVAMRVREAAQNPRNDVDDITRLIHVDPALAARIVQVANSPIYRGKSAITTCRMAVARLGLTTTRDLVTSFTMQQLFKSESPLLRQRLEELWRHSTFIAAASAVLTRLAPRLDSDRALLAGLIHCIGALPLIAFAERHPGLATDAAMLDKVMQALSGKVGAMVLRRWQFDYDMITVAREAHEWQRDPGPQVDYCDLVVLAHLYSVLDTPDAARYPALHEVPAYNKLPIERMGPRMTDKVLGGAREHVEEIQTLLYGE